MIFVVYGVLLLLEQLNVNKNSCEYCQTKDGEVDENRRGGDAKEKDDNNLLCNSSTWFEVPEKYMDEDAPNDYLDVTMCVGDIRTGRCALERWGQGLLGRLATKTTTNA